jgi:EAL domain-containing protein (putative c-di-GMP-specific phosphodiesterase class I)
VSLATRSMVGFEVLARWQHPERGLISLALFIPWPKTRLMVRLGWVMLGPVARWPTGSFP